MSHPRYGAWRFAYPVLDVPAPEAGLQVAPTGAVSLVAEDAAVRQAILLLLSTRPGERVMRPEYGCHLYRLIFAPNDDTTAGLAIHYVRRALERWEPRIDILRIDAGRNAADASILDILLVYRVRTTQRQQQLTLALPLTA